MIGLRTRMTASTPTLSAAMCCMTITRMCCRGY